MNNIYRKKARTALSGNWQLMLIACCIGLFFYETLGSIIFLLTSRDVYLKFQIAMSLGNLNGVSREELSFLMSNLFLVMVIGVVLSPFWGGFNWLALALARKQPIVLDEIFTPLKTQPVRMITFWFLYFIYIFGWTLLFIIPGIIKMHSYSMAIYLLKDNPDMTPNQAITQSCELMNGKKGELFSLAVSFVAWFILTLVVTSIIVELAAVFLFSNNPLAFDIAQLIISLILMCPFYVYFKTTLAIFYLDITMQSDSHDNLAKEEKKSILI
ncbi:DUF975 family protein [Thorsellia anophelis]|uniref:DUF975 family protein n=1 Tax=Thorsellia anophelis DSM 18579 TaxID=1123402 RepID=A0A1I0BMI0_9GAMM|nr:DUF975 family protein [Thorsellia anophelis]SET07469.1 Protein of unknown function [Thorsellia anophelis DSM 18579]